MASGPGRFIAASRHDTGGLLVGPGLEGRDHEAAAWEPG